MRWTHCVAAACAAAATLLAAGCGSDSTAGTGNGGLPPIKVATLGEYSGPSSSAIAPIRDGIVAWQKAVNAAGGIGGRQVDLVVDDDQGNGARSATMVRDLVENQGVIALVGTGGFTTDTTWAPYLEQERVPVVGGSAGTPVWNSSPMFFSQLASSAARYYSYLKMGALQGKTKAYATYCAELAACAQALPLLEKSAAAAGSRLVGSVQISASAADYNAQCLQMKNSGADLVVMTVVTDVATRLMSACTQQGFRPTYSFASTTLRADLLAMPEADGAVAWDAGFSAYGTTPAAAQYRDAMQKYAPHTAIAGAAQTGWSAGKLLEAALRHAPGTGELTSADILNGLDSLRDDTLDGLLAGGLTFQAGTPHAANKCLAWNKIEGGTVKPQPGGICLP